MRHLLALVCGATIAAAGVLAISYVALKGTADLQPLAGLAVVGGLSAVGLVASLAPPSGPWAAMQIAAGVVIAGVGWTGISHMLAGPHFEGYALVLGALGILQGILAVTVGGVRLASSTDAQRGPTAS
jgi:hypothetical protein